MIHGDRLLNTIKMKRLLESIEAPYVDLDTPMHFTPEQKAWVKKYIAINAERQRADAIDEALYEYAFWLFTNYSGGGAVGGSVAHDNAVKSIEEFKQMQKGAEND